MHQEIVIPKGQADGVLVTVIFKWNFKYSQLTAGDFIYAIL